MNKFFSKCASIFLMVAILVGCSAEEESKDKNISTLESVLNETFTVPIPKKCMINTRELTH